MSSKQKTTSDKPVPNMPRRRLSPWRVLLAVLILIGVSYGMVWAKGEWEEARITAARKPWFAAYVDVTATPRYPFEQIGDSGAKNVMLAFIVSDLNDSCTPTWGGAYTLDEAHAALDLDRRIERVRQQEGEVAISFGGLLNDELAVKCTDERALMQAYAQVIDRYGIDTIDLDLEGEGLRNPQALERRAKVIAQLQADRRAEGKSLAVWLTLPVAPFGMTEDGTTAVAKMLEHGVDVAGVNVMTMDYGGSREDGDSMQVASEKALRETHRQLGILYTQAGIELNSASVWGKIGATPMIGQNDVIGEIFTLEDAEGFNLFARNNGVVRMSMWSANRDITCGENYVDHTIVSDSCSGVEQAKYDFARLLGDGFEYGLSNNASIVTEEDPDAVARKQTPDDPATSPYPIWDKEGTYLQGTKVVWHQNVYKAKWWTQGEMPDNPVLQTWETPWQLVGPVLPGEKPIPQPTLPEGTYPEWSGLDIYEVNQRVLFNGVPYQAKWWTQGDSPAAASSSPDSSPWVPLTQEQVDAVLATSTAEVE